jgi:cytochrome P450
MDYVFEYPTSADHDGDLPPELDRSRWEHHLPRIRVARDRTALLVTGYDDVRTVLADDRFTRDVPPPGTTVRPESADGARTINLDGRPHTTLRGLVAKAFTVRAIDRMATRIQELTDGLLDDLERQGRPADLVRHVAAPLPTIVMCELLGFPIADGETLRRWCDQITIVGGSGPDQSAWQELGDYVHRAIESRRTDALQADSSAPQPLADLVRAEMDAGRLSKKELISLVIVILAGGLETTQNAISAGLVRLFRNPGQLNLLRADVRLIDTAIEEILRYQPVIERNRLQTATEDVALGDHLVPAGEVVQLVINSANRDEKVFRAGAEFDITRQPNPHLAFGHGAHHCLGAVLARQELRTVFETLLRRFPALAPAVPLEQLRWRGGHVTLGLDELPVTW